MKDLSLTTYPPKANPAKRDNLQPDRVTLVNTKDEVIGQMDKMDAHRGEGQLHRASSVYLFRSPRHPEPDNEFMANGKEEQSSHSGTVELLIQQRSSKKIVGAHQWANTICGNVRPTESYEECAYRRLREELGITQVSIQPIYKFEYHLRCNNEFSEWEMDQVFVGWYEGEVTPNPDEVQDFRWVKWSELQEKAQQSELKTKEFNTKEVQLSNQAQPKADEPLAQTITLAPWFVWMLGDKKLINNINKKNIK